MGTLSASVDSLLAPLVGLPLAIARRAADMLVLHFGAFVEVPNGSVGEYALHIQCPWRIEGSAGIVTGRQDLYTPLGEVADYDSWDYEEGNLQDQRVRELLRGYDERTGSAINATDGLVVEGIAADDYGGFALRLSGGYRLAVSPAGSTGEHWRLLRPGRDAPHVVMADRRLA